MFMSNRCCLYPININHILSKLLIFNLTHKILIALCTNTL